MPIAATDLLAYNVVNRVEDDVSTAGGARDPDYRPDFTQLAATDALEALSSSAGDTTQTVTVRGRDAGGLISESTAALNGTNIIQFSPATSFERVLEIRMDADAAGTVTVRRTSAGPTVYAIPPNERGASMLFRDSASSGSIEIRYDKIAWLNNHGSLTLTNATVELTADPDSRIRIGVHTSKGDSATIADRTTTPGGVTFVDDSTQQAVPGDTLEAGSYIGVWIEQNLPADDPPHNSSFTVQLAGTTT